MHWNNKTSASLAKIWPLWFFFLFLFFQKKWFGLSQNSSCPLSSPQRPADLVSGSVFGQLASRHECQGSHQQGGVRAPRRKNAGGRDGEAEDKEEDPLFGHRWSGRLHDLHLSLRSENHFFLSLLSRAPDCSACSLVTLATLEVTHFHTSSLISPLMLALMSALTFPLPTNRLIANLIYCGALGQSFLSGFSLKGFRLFWHKLGFKSFCLSPTFKSQRRCCCR